MMFNCVIAGVGGQGTVLASKLIAAAAIRKGLDVRTTETIGMAQRGGSVVSHIRIGEDISKIFSPIIPPGQTDAIIAFEPAEAVRQLAFLSDKGRIVVCDMAVKPAGSAGNVYDGTAVLDFLKKKASDLIIVDGAQVMQRCAKALNVALLGAAAGGGVFPFDQETLKETLTEMIPQRFIELNKTAYELGRNTVK